MKKRNAFLALLLSAGLALSLPLFAGGYWPPAVGDFDGTADYLARGADLTGNADSKVYLFSAWLRFGAEGSAEFIVANTGNSWAVSKIGANNLRIRLENAAGAAIITHDTTTTYTAGATWYHMLASGDLNQASSKSLIYVNDVSVGGAPAPYSNDTIDYTVTNWSVGALTGGANFFTGAIAELYIANEYLDISVEANRRYYISAGGRPVGLGISGNIPTGTSAIVYMRTRANNAGINSGTGGDFEIQGAPLYSDGPFPFFPLTVQIPDRGMGSRIH